MDTSTRQRFWEIIEELKKQGVTILYSSHYIEEVEHTADRILVLHQGRLIRDTTPYAMRSEEVEKHVTVPLIYQSLLEDCEEVSDITRHQDNVSFVTYDIARVWALLEEAGCQIQDIELTNRTLLDSLFDSTKE